MAAVNDGARALEVGAVLQGTGSTVRRNLGTFLILSVIFAGLPSAILGFVGLSMMRQGQVASFQLITWVQVAIALVTGNVLQGAVMHGVVSDLRGQRASIGACLAASFRVLGPLIGIGILVAIACMVGTLLLIVPGMILACALCVAAPVEVAERTGVLGALRRSRDLTRGNRWRIFGLFVVVMVLVWILNLLMVALFGGFGRTFASGVSNPLASTVIAILNGLILPAGLSVLYVELRKSRDGMGAAEIASVFD